MTSQLSQEIKKARPSLRLVSPVSYWFILLMGVFNIFLGSAFMVALDDTPDDLALKAISEIIPFFWWGVLFIALGIAKIYSIVANNWTLARYTLLAGVLLKSGWAVALTFRSFYQADNVFLNALWITMALTQIICYIYFLPPTEPRHLDGGVVEDE